jgi:hypothetical protein
MMKPGLPPPMTYEMQYLAAILDELRAIRAIISADGPPEASAFADVPLREVPRRKRAPKQAEA